MNTCTRLKLCMTIDNYISCLHLRCQRYMDSLLFDDAVKQMTQTENNITITRLCK